MAKFPFYKQPDSKDCGPTCLRIISKYYGKILPLQMLRDLSETTREGSSLLGLSKAAESIGFKTLSVKIDFKTLVEDAPLPCVVFWMKQHYVVVYKIQKKRQGYRIYISDPSYGLISYSEEEFLQNWIGKGATDTTEEGIVLVLETTARFDQQEDISDRSFSIKNYLKHYFFKYKSFIIQLALGLIGGSLLSLVFPFLTQSIVDIGIQNQDLNFIYLVLFAQIMLYIGQMGIEVIRGWILLHLSSRINISIVSDFFIKLMRLPISFFDSRVTADIMQRIADHGRIEQLLTNNSLQTLFSLINFLVFGVVLLFYSYKLFIIYLVGAVLYFFWIAFFLKKRRELDYKQFSQLAEEQGQVMELINGMQEIKMNNAETNKRWQWEGIQIKVFRIKIRALKLEQIQTIGGNIINQLKDVFISFIAASLVVEGQLTLGMMLSVQYIIGQLNSPLIQFMNFIRQTQDAKIALERLNEIHGKDDEESLDNNYASEIPEQNISVTNLTFRYKGSTHAVFENLNLLIPYEKTTAIVGASGSGKTTLMKLLTKFYDADEGEIKIGKTDIRHIAPSMWRASCGVVMQDGYIFNESIANNIAMGNISVDKQKLKHAVEIAHIKDFIESLPVSYNTKIGYEGLGISGGQRQRMLIARAVYKSPQYVFFDEATSALDANTEKVITDNLNQFLKGRTAVIIAHRLSTVKNANKIIVLDKGKVVEEGTHEQLVSLKGEYYRLVKNQLELGN
ncbi:MULTISPECIES: peptidase domain-containing ABC transporter [Sphingobacterium]|uniref:peptidase domain-containing ABC transporter n=1 Tax=Sphingobacterium TaxID=28453 RepID=UPI0010452CA3|nr:MULTISPECIES: peptidase domain-containing ABC transporter [Sphingobacterium]MBB2952269.1 ATP-binding cassette subfamily B protein [Sphingobacterium sp. JUb56]MCW2260729.1 ATP-binding cassette subfamily B protein [Sphingobacterium kitahiroshimense]NJI75746.1 peptidase domain-containing ABC transporter [Sphingobacterium sp. B16(2022)]TCR09027.1 ATP-binding cassette subfamily B protein [Sphingobacterium sp. JUb78]